MVPDGSGSYESPVVGLSGQWHIASRASAKLRTPIEREFADVRATVGEGSGQIDRNEQSVKQSLNEAPNGLVALVALVAEVDDKIDRALARNAGET